MGVNLICTRTILKLNILPKGISVYFKGTGGLDSSTLEDKDFYFFLESYELALFVNKSIMSLVLFTLVISIVKWNRFWSL